MIGVDGMRKVLQSSPFMSMTCDAMDGLKDGWLDDASAGRIDLILVHYDSVIGKYQ